MTIETEGDLQALKGIGGIVARVLKEMIARTEPGMTTAELDDIGRVLLEKFEANSAPRLTYGFPGYTCISINEEAAHGVPGPRVIKAGDMVNIDVSAEKNGYFADTGGSFVVPPGSPLKARLLHSTRLALREACGRARAGQPLNGIGKAIQTVAKKSGLKIVKNLCSHGVGRQLHEEPAEITGYYEPRDRRQLHNGLVITIEPFLSSKSTCAVEADDGWTLVTGRGNLTAQFEHTMVITKGQPILLTVA
ncbi:type I methionyl aminopeptidase [Exilibacterium tricleocarpae]|uniref:Methionine aminopeptidase n=1 Tax=Exilibacterium tricleocarpae TaxID=2591008 RepID=A0A545U597_9GAMM|nr:type I methionyl aminopeptidase [Exilibacterium tricleocarpae]TQV84640.1 type I methionyl aminopeptidase [Exilibacterium tricleocarpae]